MGTTGPPWGGGGGARGRVGNQQVSPRRSNQTTLREINMRKKAVVARFMTFFQREDSMVIEMYESAFYRSRPTMDKIADFVHSDLCTSLAERESILDVQFHPVKMLLFVKFKPGGAREEVVARLQSDVGIKWSAYGVRLKGYSLDAQVKFIRLLGVPPETTKEEIKDCFRDQGLGEVLDINKGMLDTRRLPGVTNGTWAIRLKVRDQDVEIPSYIYRKDEGELWSLNFEGRQFACWKCGSSAHIGDRCWNMQTFDEMFNGSVNDENFSKPTWAMMVQKNLPGDDAVRTREKEIELDIRNKNRARVKAKEKEDDEAVLKAAELVRKENERLAELERVRLERENREKEERDARLHREAIDGVQKQDAIETARREAEEAAKMGGGEGGNDVVFPVSGIDVVNQVSASKVTMEPPILSQLLMRRGDEGMNISGEKSNLEEQQGVEKEFEVGAGADKGLEVEQEGDDDQGDKRELSTEGAKGVDVNLNDKEVEGVKGDRAEGESEEGSGMEEDEDDLASDSGMMVQDELNKGELSDIFGENANRLKDQLDLELNGGGVGFVIFSSFG